MYREQRLLPCLARSVFLALFALLCVAMFAAPAFAADAAVSGQVKGFDAPGGLEGCEVRALRWEGSGWYQWDTAPTGDAGDYNLSALMPGLYRIEFAGPTEGPRQGDYQTRSYQNALGAFGPSSLASTIIASSGSAHTSIDATLPLGYHIAGTVVDEAAPTVGVSAVTVDLFRWVASLKEWRDVGGDYTGVDGKFDIGALPDGKYRLRFQTYSGDFLDECYDGVPGTNVYDSQCTTITLPADVPVDLAVSLKRAAHLQGKVAGADAAGASGLEGLFVNAYLWTGSAWTYSETGYTGDGGTYDIGGLQGGDYRVLFQGNDYWGPFADYRWYLSECYDDVPGENINDSQCESVTVPAGGVKASVDATLALRPVGSLTGTVTGWDAPGGLPDMDVEAWGWDEDGGTGEYFTTPTVSGGTYEFTVPAGDYRVLFNGDASHLTECYFNVPTDFVFDSRCSTVTVLPAQATTGVDADLERAYRITGKVTGEDAPAGVPFQIVSVHRWDGVTWTGFYSDSTDTTGTYDIGDLPEGDYRIWFRGGSKYYDECYDDIRTSDYRDNSCTSVTVSPATPIASANATLSLKPIEPTGKIEGTVTTEDFPEGFEYAPVAVRRWSGSTWGSLRSDATDSIGAYLISNLALGDYRAVFTDGSGTYMTECFNDLPGKDYTDAACTTITVGASPGPSVGATLALAGHITGTITAEDIQDVVEGAEVEASLVGTTSPLWMFTTETDQYGTYNIGGLPAGTYSVRISFEGYNDVTFTVTVEAGVSSDDHDYVLEVVTGPEFEILGVTDGGAYNHSVSPSAFSAEPGVIFTATLNAVPHTLLTPISVPGHYTLVVTATGATGSTEKTVVFDIDITPPAGTMSIDNGAAVTSTTTVSIDSTVTDAVEMRVNSGSGFGAWMDYAEHTSAVLTDGNGEKTVNVEYRDAAGNVLPLSDAITLDTTLVPSGTMSIDNGAAYTTTTTVSIDSTVTNATQMRIDAGTGFTGWMDYAAQRSVVVTDGLGQKTVDVEYRNAALNVLALSDSIVLDTEPPAGAMSIDNGAAYTTTTNVSIDSTVTDAIQMRIDLGAGIGDWMDYAAHVSTDLPTGDGPKTVAVEYRGTGIRTLVLVDTIALDTAPPAGTMSIDNDAAFTATTTVSIDSTVTGATQMRIDSGIGFGDWTDYVAQRSTVLTDGPGLKTVNVEYRDAAGNMLALSDSVTFDDTAPYGVMSIDNGASYTATTTVSIDSTVTNATQMRVDLGAGFGDWMNYAAQVTTSVPEGDGVKDVSVEYRNSTSIWTLALSDSIILDTTAPTGTMSIAEGAAFTTTTTVSVDSTVTGASQMAIDVGSGFGGWTDYVAHVSVELPSGDGEKTVTVKYRDLAENVLTLSDTITLDTTPPSGTMLVNNGAAVTATTTVSVDSAVTGAVEMSINSGGGFGDWVGYAAAKPAVLIGGDGLRTVTVKYRDTAGNESTLSDTITLDTTPPVITVTGVSQGGTYTSAVSPNATANEPAQLSATLNGATFTLGSSVTAPAAYTLVVTAVDVAGWASQTTVTFTLASGGGGGGGEATDTVAPVTTLSGAPAGWASAPVTITLSATDAGAGVANTYYTLNGGAVITYTGPFVLSAEGTTTVAYWSVDKAPTPNTEVHKGATVRIDKTPPTIIVSGGGTFESSTTVSASVTDVLSGVSSVRYRINGGAWTTGSSVAFSAAGTYLVEFEATDVAGNVATASATAVIEVVPATTAITARATSAVYYPNKASVTGTLTTTGSVSTAGLPVHLETWVTGKGWTPVAGGSGLTGPGGAYKLQFTPKQLTLVRVMFGGSSGLSPCGSRGQTVRVRAKLTISSAPRIARNGPFIVAASIAPAHFGRIRLTIARRVGRRWVPYRTFSATGVSRVRFRIKLRQGTFRMHVVHSDTKHLWSRSAYRLITIR